MGGAAGKSSRGRKKKERRTASRFARRDYEALARDLSLSTIPSLTNFVAIDLASAQAAERVAALLDENDVFVRRPGVPPLDRLIRITVGTPTDRATLAPTFRAAVAALDGG